MAALPFEACWVRLVLVCGLVALPGGAMGQQSVSGSDGSLPDWVGIRSVTIPDADSTSGVLDGWLVTPRAPGKHPLAIVGVTFLGVPVKEVGPGQMLPEAEWFVRRGWAVGIFLRRGFGASGKFPHIGILKCGTQDVEEYSDFQTKDLRVVLPYFSSLPEVDGTRVIVAEDSADWGDVVWIADDAPKSLKGILNFGDHGLFNLILYRNKCLQGSMLPALRRVGAKSQVPMMWIYGSVNAKGQESTKECLDAFVSSGGHAELDVLKDYDYEDASYLFNMDPEKWGPAVEEFLAKQGLPSEPIFAAPAVPDLKLPKGASDEAQKGFASYLLRGPNKAFAMGANSAWAYRFGRSTLKLAEKDALENCAGCVIVASQGK